MMKNLALFLLVTLILSACAGSQGEAPGDVLREPEGMEAIPSAEFTLAPDAPVNELTSGPLTARIFSASDATVNTEPYIVQGSANQEIVVTINDLILTNSPGSIFSVPVDLEEGPNLIDIVISDLEGNEVSITLTITFEP
ncbi:MAG: hypothetical protein ACYC3H_10725 [Bellilinea sp.]